MSETGSSSNSASNVGFAITFSDNQLHQQKAEPESFIESLKKKYSSATLADLIETRIYDFTYEYVLFQALLRLGFPQRPLPLNDIHLYNALVTTLMLYSKYKPAVAQASYFLSGQNRFVVPSDRYVIKVEPQLEFGTSGDMYNANEFILFTRLQSPLNLRRYTIIQQWVSTSRNLFNPSNYFLVRKEEVEVNGVKRLLNVLYLNNSFPTNCVNVYFTKSWEIHDLPYFPQEDRAWLINFLSERLKYTIGEIYAAMGDTLPGDQAQFNLNGTTMKTEAQAIMDKLEQELIASSQKVLPIFG